MHDSGPHDLSSVVARLADTSQKLHETGIAIADAMSRLATNNGGGSATIYAGGIANGVAICGVAALAISMLIFGAWFMLTMDGLRQDIKRGQQDSADREQAWIAVWNKRINEQERKQ